MSILYSCQSATGGCGFESTHLPCTMTRAIDSCTVCMSINKMYMYIHIYELRKNFNFVNVLTFVVCKILLF